MGGSLSTDVLLPTSSGPSQQARSGARDQIICSPASKPDSSSLFHWPRISECRKTAIQLNLGADGWDLGPNAGGTGVRVREAEPSCSAQISSRSQSWLHIRITCIYTNVWMLKRHPRAPDLIGLGRSRHWSLFKSSPGDVSAQPGLRTTALMFRG